MAPKFWTSSEPTFDFQQAFTCNVRFRECTWTPNFYLPRPSGWHWRRRKIEVKGLLSLPVKSISIESRCFWRLCPWTSRRISLEVWCFRYILGVQVTSQQVFGCLGCFKKHIFNFGCLNRNPFERWMSILIPKLNNPTLWVIFLEWPTDSIEIRIFIGHKYPRFLWWCPGLYTDIPWNPHKSWDISGQITTTKPLVGHLIWGFNKGILGCPRKLVNG